MQHLRLFDKLAHMLDCFMYSNPDIDGGVSFSGFIDGEANQTLDGVELFNVILGDRLMVLLVDQLEDSYWLLSVKLPLRIQIAINFGGMSVNRAYKEVVDLSDASLVVDVTLKHLFFIHIVLNINLP
jgi:hypothetical protein